MTRPDTNPAEESIERTPPTKPDEALIRQLIAELQSRLAGSLIHEDYNAWLYDEDGLPH